MKNVTVKEVFQILLKMLNTHRFSHVDEHNNDPSFPIIHKNMNNTKCSNFSTMVFSGVTSQSIISAMVSFVT